MAWTEPGKTIGGQLITAAQWDALATAGAQTSVAMSEFARAFESLGRSIGGAVAAAPSRAVGRVAVAAVALPRRAVSIGELP